MKKLNKIFKPLTIGITSTIAVATAVSPIALNTNNIISINQNINSTDTKAAINTFDSLKDYSQLNTSKGYLQINVDTNNPIKSSTSSIKLISFYGSLIWQYDLKNSNFLNLIGGEANKKINEETLKDLKIQYNENQNYIVVYGHTTGATKSFLFVLNPDTGSEFTSSGSDYNKYLLAYKKDGKETNKLPSQIDIIGFNQKDYFYVSSYATLNELKQNGLYKISYPALNSSVEKLNSTYFTSGTNSAFKTDDATLVGLGYLDKNIHYLLFGNKLGDANNKSDETLVDELSLVLTNENMEPFNNGTKALSINMSSKTNGVFNSDSSTGGTWGTFGDTSSNKHSIPTSGDQQTKLKNLSTKPVVQSDNSKMYLGFVSNTFNVSLSFTYTSLQGDLTLTDFNGILDANSSDAKSYDTSKSQVSSVAIDTNQNKIYVAFKTGNKPIGLFDPKTKTVTIDNLISSEVTNQNTYLDSNIIWFGDNNSSQLLLAKTTDTNQKIYGLYNDSSSTNNGFKLKEISMPTLKDLNQTVASNNLSNLLPADYTDTNIESLIQYEGYTQITDNTTIGENQFKVTYSNTSDPNYKADNANGILSFQPTVTFKKWWTTTGTYDVKLSTLTLSNLTKDSDKVFRPVSSSDVNSEKWTKQQEILNSKYANQITAQEIIDYFFIFGPKVSINASNVQINYVENNKSTPSIVADNIYITATVNNNEGTMRVVYENPIKTNSTNAIDNTGNYVFNFKNNISSYNKIQVNQTLYNSLRTSKSLVGVTKQDIINVLDLSSGYSTALKDWEVSGLYDGNNVNDVDIWNGIPNITVKYLKREGIDPDDSVLPDSSIPNNNNLKINSTIGNFISLKSQFTTYTTNDNEDGYLTNGLFKFNLTHANGLASGQSLESVKNKLDNILSPSLTIKNNVVDYQSVKKEILEADDNHMLIRLSIPKDTTTNIIFGDAYLKLNDTVNTLIENESTTKGMFDTLDINLTIKDVNYALNYDLGKYTSSVSKGDIPTMNNVGFVLPSSYLEKYSMDNQNSYTDWNNQVNLLSAQNNGASSYDNYNIEQVILTADDADGSIKVSYKLDFYDLGVKRIVDLKITGFLSTFWVTFFWLSLIILITAIIMIIWIIIHYNKKNKKEFKLWSTKDGQKKTKEISEKYRK